MNKTPHWSLMSCEDDPTRYYTERENVLCVRIPPCHSSDLEFRSSNATLKWYVCSTFYFGKDPADHWWINFRVWENFHPTRP